MVDSSPTQLCPYYPGKKVYTMYHGTDLESAFHIIEYGFKVSESGMLGKGVYISRDPSKAKRYPLQSKENQVILQLSVKVGKVKRIDCQGHPLQLTWHDKGYDTAWVPPNCGMVPSGLEEDCVFDPKRIRVVGIFQAPPEYLDRLKKFISLYQQ